MRFVLWIAIATAFCAIAACGGGAPDQELAAANGLRVVTPDPTAQSGPIVALATELTPEPTPTSVALTLEPTPTPVTVAPTPELTAELIPLPVTPTPSPEPLQPPAPDLPAELVEGMEALIACAGRTEEYWLANGPPPITSELAECLTVKLGVELGLSPGSEATRSKLPEDSAELVEGIQALIACAGQTEEYWLANGPPPITPELTECLTEKLGVELGP